MRLLKEGNAFIFKCEFWENHLAKAIPDRKWVVKNKQWEAPVTLANAKYFYDVVDSSDIEPEAMKKINELLDGDKNRLPFPSWYKFKNSPMKCQREALNKSFVKEAFAYIMDMGTGKSFTAINFAAAKAMMGEINGMLIVCDTGIKPVWMKEFEEHCPIDYDIFIMESGAAKNAEKWINKTSDRLKVLVVGVESLSTGPYAKQIANLFVLKHATYMTIDESSSIKNPSTKRTKICWELGGLCKYRSILNGTPVDEGVENLFSQFRFLDWSIIGVKNYTVFKNRYCVMGGFEGRKIVGYNNLKDLFKRIEPYVYTVKITDVEDMPKRLYEEVIVEPTSEQKKILNDMASKMMTASQDDRVIEVETVLERMTRYQQVTGGYFPYDLTPEELSMARKSDPKHGITKIAGKNPKMDALIEQVEKLDSKRKFIIWARFSREREDIVKWFEKNRPGTYVHLGAGLSSQEKYDMMEKFQTDPQVTAFITSQQIGSKGLTLTAATVAFYYSNSFSYTQREQSERRPWRKGQKHPCLYVNLTMNHKIDKQINKALRDKKSIADFVMEQMS